MNSKDQARRRPAHGQTPTVADVADTAGVSRQTVSNVSTPHTGCARRRGPGSSRPSPRSATSPTGPPSSLRVAASRMIGYRIEPMHAESMASIHDRFLHALAEAGREADHHLLLFTADDAEDEIAACTRLFRAGGVDGVRALRHRPRRPAAVGAAAPRVPFAAFGRSDYDADHPWVDVDNAAGTPAAVEHLVARGHRRIAFLGWPEGAAVGDRRAEGWRTTLTSTACSPTPTRSTCAARTRRTRARR